MSDIDPSKLNSLKVAELKDELKKRGLDTKGVKAQLVKRLQQALRNSQEGEAENDDVSETEAMDTSQATDTSVNESSQVDTSLDLSQTNVATECSPIEQDKVVEQEHKTAPVTVPVAQVKEPDVQEPVKVSPEKTVPAQPVAVPEKVQTLAVAAPDNVVAAKHTPEKVVPVPEAVQKVTPVKLTPEKPAPTQVTPQKISPVKPTTETIALVPDIEQQGTTPVKTTSENIAPAAVTPVKLTPEKSAPVATPVPSKPTPEKAAPVPSNLTPEKAAPVIASPAKASPAKSTPEKLAAISTEPEQVSPLKPTPEKALAVADKESPVKASPAKEAETEQTNIPAEQVTDVKMETESEQKPESIVSEKSEQDNNDDKKSETVKMEGESEESRPRRKRSRSPSEEKHKSRRSRSRSPRKSRHSRSRSRSNERKRHRSRSRSQERRRSPERIAKVEPEESEDWLAATDVQLDRYNSDLSLIITESGVSAQPMTSDGFAFMWTGAKATYGVKMGKVCFEVKVLSHLNVDHLPPEEDNRHVLRVGFSAGNASIQLGEEKLSYGFGGTGKASTECKFIDYGQPFTAGDVVTAYVDFSSDPAVISFAVNGTYFGKCFDVPLSSLEEQALFPHVLSKNCEFECNFGQKEEPFFPIEEGFVFINSVPLEERIRGPLPPAKKEDCEMLMMCGLPGCGKTTWVGKYTVENTDKLYNVLGTNSIIDKMKVMGLPRKRNYTGRWDVLIDMSTKCLNKLLEIAAKKKRNYILDQTNVYPSAQRRKMRPFEGFQRKAVVIVPSDEEFKRRCDQREKEEGKEIPDSAVLEMKANFQLPEEGTIFDKVDFIELQREEAQPVVDEYNKEGKAAQPPDYKRFRGGDRQGGRGSRFSDRGYDNPRPYRGGGGGSYSDNRRGGGGGYYNRDRDSGYSRGGYGERRGGYNDSRGSRSYSSYGQGDRRHDQYSSGGSSGGYRDRRDNRGSSQGSSSWSSGGRGGGSGGWKSGGSGGGSGSSYSQPSGGWKSQSGSQQTPQTGWQAPAASSGYGAQSGWGGQDWSAQGYQQPQANWGQWPTGYGQQQTTQQQTGTGQWPAQNYSYTTSWNPTAASATWPTYGPQQTWDYSSGQYK